MNTNIKEKKAAGIVIYYNLKDKEDLNFCENININKAKKGINILFLETENKKLDLPKGVADLIVRRNGNKELESTKECAIRETYEECNILVKRSKLSKEKIKIENNLTFYFYKADLSDLENVKFLPNPETNIIEHNHGHLINVDDLENINILSFLKPSIKDFVKTIKEFL